MPIARRPLLAAPLALAARFGAGRALAQAAWPSRPVRLISPFAPGGPQDLPGRFICEHLSQRLGQPFILESRAGAGGALGMHYVATATDQHTLLLTSSAIATLPSMRRELGFDPFTDLPAVSLVTESPLTITTRAQGGVADFPALLARARAQPGKVSFATSGIGSATHFAGELLAVKAGIRLLHVPYRGASVALNALLAGDVDLVIGDISIVLEQVRAGTLRALATSLPARTALLPEVPAVAEFVPGYAVPFWIGLFAARAMPPGVVAQLNAAMAPLRESELAPRMAALGATLRLDGPAPLAARLAQEVPQWREVAATAGIVPE